MSREVGRLVVEQFELVAKLEIPKTCEASVGERLGHQELRDNMQNLTLLGEDVDSIARQHLVESSAVYL